MKFEKINAYLDSYTVWVRIVISVVLFFIGGVLVSLFLPLSTYAFLVYLGGGLLLLSLVLFCQTVIRGANLVVVVAASAFLFVFMAVPVWHYVEERYVDYQLLNFGSMTKGYALEEILGKKTITKSGRRIVYFYEVEGVKLKGIIETDRYRLGDTLRIQYSRNNPEIHRVVL